MASPAVNGSSEAFCRISLHLAPVTEGLAVGDGRSVSVCGAMSGAGVRGFGPGSVAGFTNGVGADAGFATGAATGAATGVTTIVGAGGGVTTGAGAGNAGGATDAAGT